MALHHAAQARIADRIEPWEHGTVVFATAVPDYWDGNAVRVEGGDPGLTFDALAAAADRLQEGLRHRKVEVEDETAGARVRPGFAAAGWRTERLVWMRRGGAPAGPAAPVEEVPFADTRALRETWYLGDDGFGDAAAVARFLAVEDHVAARLGTRTFAVREGGRPIAFATAWASADAAEVTAAFVLPEHRRRGVGAALVLAAAAAMERAEQWIVADDEGRPKALYARLGFTPAWRQHTFIRHPRPSG